MKIIISPDVTEYSFVINSRKDNAMTMYYWQIFLNGASKADKPQAYIVSLFSQSLFLYGLKAMVTF